MEWISVKDRLPQVNSLVYVIRHPDNKILPAEYRKYNESTDADFLWDSWGKDCDCCEEYYMSNISIDTLYWILRSDILPKTLANNDPEQ